jgi:hypothetical protein
MSSDAEVLKACEQILDRFKGEEDEGLSIPTEAKAKTSQYFKFVKSN